MATDGASSQSSPPPEQKKIQKNDILSIELKLSAVRAREADA